MHSLVYLLDSGPCGCAGGSLWELLAGTGVYVCSLSELHSQLVVKGPDDFYWRDGFWKMSMYSAPCLVRLWMHAQASVHATFGRFLRWYLFVRLFLVRSTGTSFFWESTSGNAVFSASWFDSGYTLTFSTCTLLPAVTCWVLVALGAQFFDFLGDDGCYGLLVAGLWVPTTTLHRGRPGFSTLSAIRRNLWYGLGFLSVDVFRTPVEGLVRQLPSLCAWLPKLELLCRSQKSSSFRLSGCQCIAHCTCDFARSSPIWCSQLECH